MNKRMKIAAIACAVLIPVGLAVALNGSADASSAKHHGWPSSTKASSTQIAKQAHATKSGAHVLTVIEHEVRNADVDTGDPGESPGDYSSSRAGCSTRTPETSSAWTPASA